MSEKPSFQMSVDARLIYQRLRKVSIGQTILHAEIEAEVSRPVEKVRGAIQTAINRALRDDGMVFVSVRSVGYLRCRDTDIVDNAAADTKAVRRRARKAVERLTKVADYAALAPAKQLEHTARLSVLSAITSLAQESSVERVKKASTGRNQELPLAETMRAFLGDRS